MTFDKGARTLEAQGLDLHEAEGSFVRIVNDVKNIFKPHECAGGICQYKRCPTRVVGLGQFKLRFDEPNPIHVLLERPR